MDESERTDGVINNCSSRCITALVAAIFREQTNVVALGANDIYAWTKQSSALSEMTRRRRTSDLWLVGRVNGSAGFLERCDLSDGYSSELTFLQSSWRSVNIMPS